MGGGLKPSSLIEVYAYGEYGGQWAQGVWGRGGATVLKVGGAIFFNAFWVKIGFKIVISMEYLWDFEKVAARNACELTHILFCQLLRMTTTLKRR